MKVKCLPLQPLCFAFGGFEIQILSTLNAISEQGVEIGKLDIWDRSAEFDILHCWGLGFSNFENYVWAKKTGKKLIATILLHYFETNAQKLRFKVSQLAGGERLLIKMLSYVDAVVVVNDEQADVCNRLYKVPASKINVIPHVVDDKYFAARPPNAMKKDEVVLITGNVCPRKNQVLLAEACIKANINLRIVGKVLDGEYEYGQQLSKLVEANKNITWIKGLKENSDELIQHYLDSSIIALPSFIEQQPIALLEAAVLQKPILTADLAYGRQKYYNNACLVDVSSLSSITNGLKEVMKNPSKFIPDSDILLNCKAQNVGKAYIDLYNKL